MLHKQTGAAGSTPRGRHRMLCPFDEGCGEWYRRHAVIIDMQLLIDLDDGEPGLCPRALAGLGLP